MGVVRRVRERFGAGPRAPVGSTVVRASPARTLAFGALLIALMAVLGVLFVIRHDRERWTPIGASTTVAGVPSDAAIALVAARRGATVTVVGFARGRRRCLPIQFAVVGQPGRSAGIDGVCLPGRLVGSGLAIDGRRVVRVFAAGTLLAELRADDLGGCSRSTSLCAMGFDRHGARVELQTRDLRPGEVDRDNGLDEMFRNDGAQVVATEGRSDRRRVRFGAASAGLWNVAAEPARVEGEPPSTDRLVDALLTRASGTAAVRVVVERPGGSSRTLVPGSTGAFVDG